ncbi:hypothetical protein Taro_004447 [Colocasia esculenta]|uniref:Uncharacterized protein n=1 Tax=Colocasia esculenta TaxID=4460 RepID=A0A843TI66_COLES|nr:hypothetical protein [Colocasia esculenta]
MRYGGTGLTACSVAGPVVRCLVPGGIACANEAASCFEQGLLGELDRTGWGVSGDHPWRPGGLRARRLRGARCSGALAIAGLSRSHLVCSPCAVFENYRWDPWGFGS